MIRNTFVLSQREMINNRALTTVIGVVFFMLATALGAYVRIPVPGSPVPITLQTFFVLLSGAVLGKRLGMASQIGYIFLGLSGLPVFQGCAFGITHLLGPTGGYLIGFICASYFIGKAFENKDVKPHFVALTFVLCNFILYIPGIAWLMMLYKINILHALSIGILPFIPGDILKILAATMIYGTIAKRSHSIFSI